MVFADKQRVDAIDQWLFKWAMRLESASIRISCVPWTTDKWSKLQQQQKLRCIFGVIRWWMGPADLHVPNVSGTFILRHKLSHYFIFLLDPLHFDVMTHSNALHSCFYLHHFICSSRTWGRCTLHTDRCRTVIQIYAMHVDCGTFRWFVAWCGVDKMRCVVFFFFVWLFVSAANADGVSGVFINSHRDIMATKIINRSKFVGYVKCCVN